MAKQKAPAKKRGSQGKKGDKPEKTIVTGSLARMETGNLKAVSGNIGGIQVLTIDEELARETHAKILEARRRHEETYFQLAALLYKVNSLELYRKIGPGYNSFKDYVEGELEYAWRSANYLAGIWWWFGVQLSDNPELLERARKLGWTKAKELVRVVDPSNADEWFDLAERLPARDLIKARRAALKAAGESPRMKLPPSELEKARQAQEAADFVAGAPAAEGEEQPPEAEEPPEVEEQPPEVEEQAEEATMKPMKPMETPEQKDGRKTQRESPRWKSVAGVSVPTPDQIEEEKEKDDEWQTFNFRVPKDDVETIKTALDCAKETSEQRIKHDGVALGMIALWFVGGHDRRGIVVGEFLQKFEAKTGLTVMAIDPAKRSIVYGEEKAMALVDGGSENEDES